MIKASALLFLFFAISPLSAATDSAGVDAIVKRAIDYMDRNLPEQALQRWDSVLAIEPNNVTYKYERAISLAMWKEYEQAIKALEPIYRDSALYDRGYQLMGNCYDYLEKSDKAMTYYKSGLEKFPTSGRLHYEMGAASYMSRDVKNALDWWIKGTRVEPWFATNYFWVAKAAASTPDKIWTVFFGETFINIEPNTPRSKEISILLYNTWNASMSLGDENDPINFCSDTLLEAPSQFGPSAMNFATAFEFTVAQSSQLFIPDTGVRRKLSIEQLVEVRKKFLDGWKGAGYLSKYPNDLIAWNQRIKEAGWFTEYLWWLYGHGDMTETRGFLQQNEQRYDTFFGWLMQNPFVPDHPLCLGIHCSK